MVAINLSLTMKKSIFFLLAATALLLTACVNNGRQKASGPVPDAPITLIANFNAIDYGEFCSHCRSIRYLWNGECFVREDD